MIEDKFLTLHALNMQKVQDAFNADNAAFMKAKKEKDGERSQYGEWLFNGKPFNSPDAWVSLLDGASNAIDPFGAAVTLAAGEPLMPVSEKATWCAVAISAGFLVIDRIPFASLARKDKLLFRKAQQLPGAVNPARKLAREELVIAGKKVKNLVVREADAVNAELLPKGMKYPYAKGTKVEEFILDEEVSFVHYFTPGFNTKAGQWMALSSEAGGMTSKQLHKHFCLPKSPTHWSVVKVPRGTKIRKGIVGKQDGLDGTNNWGHTEKGGVQFQLLDRINPENFIDLGILP